jgi:hypothetical protein
MMTPKIRELRFTETELKLSGFEDLVFSRRFDDNYIRLLFKITNQLNITIVRNTIDQKCEIQHIDKSRDIILK